MTVDILRLHITVAVEETVPLPRYDELLNPVLQALRELDGSASIAEIEESVMKNLSLPEQDLSKPHKTGPQTELQYRLAWARTYLKIYGLLSNSARGIWVLTSKGIETQYVEPRQVVRYVREVSRAPSATREPQVPDGTEEEDWGGRLLRKLRGLSPEAFERLVQRLMRESGFTRVNVTGRSGDGGIDGTGIVQIGGLLSFPILFQCKRYAGSVGAGAIRDFRGAMVGRTDRGLVITTGTFTREAKLEATRDGAPLIDLVDGDALAAKLKELRLGVRVSTRTVEDVTLVDEFFDAL